MKIYIDESWDVGFKETSSEYFCFALVIFDSDEKIAHFREMMTILRKKLKMRNDYEFHYSHMPRRTKKEFCAHIALCEFDFYGLIIQKRLLIANSIKDKKRFYNYTASLIIHNVQEKISESSDIYIDGSGDRSFRQEISNYLKFKFNDAWKNPHGAQWELRWDTTCWFSCGLYTQSTWVNQRWCFIYANILETKTKSTNMATIDTENPLLSVMPNARTQMGTVWRGLNSLYKRYHIFYVKQR